MGLLYCHCLQHASLWLLNGHCPKQVLCGLLLTDCALQSRICHNGCQQWASCSCRWGKSDCRWSTAGWMEKRGHSIPLAGRKWHQLIRRHHLDGAFFCRDTWWAIWVWGQIFIAKRGVLINRQILNLVAASCEPQRSCNGLILQL